MKSNCLCLKRLPRYNFFNLLSFEIHTFRPCALTKTRGELLGASINVGLKRRLLKFVHLISSFSYPRRGLVVLASFKELDFSALSPWGKDELLF